METAQGRVARGRVMEPEPEGRAWDRRQKKGAAQGA